MHNRRAAAPGAHAGRMKNTFRPEDAAPIRTADEARERVVEFIGRAIRRQLWLMLLGADGIQSPVLVPVDGIPLRTDPGSLARVAAAVAELLTVQAPGGSVILTLERPGTAAITAPDQAWAAALVASFGQFIPITGMFLAHDDGVCELHV